MVKRYLDVVSLDTVENILATGFICMPGTLRVPLEDAAGCITAGPIFARYSIPEIHLSAMDGIAVVSSQTEDASEQNPVTIMDAVRVNTGNVVPPGFDAVIMIEDVWEENGRFTIRKAVSLGQHVRPAGEDLAESEMVIPGGHRIRAHELGALAGCGVTDIDVISVQVGLVPTGNELVPRGIRPGPGQVVESNTLMASAMLAECGAHCTRYPIVKDDPVSLRDIINRAVDENDIVIISAGSSAGTRDYTADIIRELGEVFVHGIATKPGKPAIIGKIREKPVFGMPGYPLSALTMVREIIIPFLARYGLPVPGHDSIPAYLSSAIAKEAGSDEFVLCTLGKIGDRWVITPQSRGAAVQMSAVRANAYLKLPAMQEGCEPGDLVQARLMVPKRDAENALLLTGSHDPVIDYLADLLQRRGISLISTHVGSMKGLLMLGKNECHAAPTHLLSPDGSYNTEYLKRYFPGTDVILVSVAGREQGIVSRDGISLPELRDCTFINRQKGSGTRVLLDYELNKAGISPRDIRGYEREVTTHIAVALAVRSGEADAGMCVFSAANALGLPFVPVAQEQYEIAIRKEQVGDARIRALIETIRQPRFRDILDSLGGYDTTVTGRQRTVS